MNRFFVSPSSITEDIVTLRGSVVRQLVNVFRSRIGDHIVVLDDTGWEYEVVIKSINSGQAKCEIMAISRSYAEPAIKIILYQALLKGTKFETVLQKGTELGVTTFVPVLCTRSIPRLKDDRWVQSRYRRWRRIIIESAEQCRRGKLPCIRSPLDFSAACDIGSESPSFILWEKETAKGLKGILKSWNVKDNFVDTISIFVGPEGGFSADEVGYASSRKIVPVSLGGRILRAETASIATVAAVMYELGGLGD